MNTNNAENLNMPDNENINEGCEQLGSGSGEAQSEQQHGCPVLWKVDGNGDIAAEGTDTRFNYTLFLFPTNTDRRLPERIVAARNADIRKAHYDGYAECLKHDTKALQTLIEQRLGDLLPPPSQTKEKE